MQPATLFLSLALCAQSFLGGLSAVPYCPRWAAIPGAEKQITITFSGDSTLGSEEAVRPLPGSFDSRIAAQGLSYPYRMVQSVFRQDDLTVVNLEGVFYDVMANKQPKVYNFRGPCDFAKILPLSSVELAFVSNNHIMDYGKPGALSTVAALEQQGVPWFGQLPFQGGGHYIYEKEGVKIGFLGCWIGFWMTNPATLSESFEALKAQGCHAIVACMHGGVEYARAHDGHQEKLANWFIKKGADVVIGHHPHVLQDVAQKGRALIFYSLGNFAFGGNLRLRAEATTLVQLRFSFGANNTCLGYQANIIPAQPSGTVALNDFQPLLLLDAAARDVMDAFNKASKAKFEPYIPFEGAMQKPVVYAQMPQKP